MHNITKHYRTKKPRKKLSQIKKNQVKLILTFKKIYFNLIIFFIKT